MEKLTIKVSLDREVFTAKPSVSKQYKDFTNNRNQPITEVAILGSRVGRNVERIDFEKFSNYISTRGYTWSPFIFLKCPIAGKVRRRTELFSECETLAIDIDGGIDHQGIIDRCNQYGLTPNLIHETFSSSEELRKYRVVFILEEPVDDAECISCTIRTLLKWFPEADPAAKDLARLYFGSNKGILTICTDHKNKIEIDQDIQANFNKLRNEDIFERINKRENKDNTLSNFVFDEEKEKKDINYALLTPTQKKFIEKTLVKAYREIASVTKESGKYRYSTLFSLAERLTGIKGMYGKTIVNHLLKAVSLNPFYTDNWSYDAEEVILSAIEWKCKTPNIAAGDVFDIDVFLTDNQKTEEKN